MTMNYCRVAVMMGVVLLAGCSKAPKNDMTGELTKIRAMVIQSALVTVQAACSEPAGRGLLVDGALSLLRRATAGPEMMHIHQMMGEMNMDKPGETPAQPKDQPGSPQMAMHTAVHAAGGDGFNLLDALTRPPGLTCAQVRPVSLAASAALLRGYHEENTTQDSYKMLDQEVDAAAAKLDGAVKEAITDQTPDVVRVFTQALQKL